METRSIGSGWDRTTARESGAGRLLGLRQRLYPKRLLSSLMFRATRVRFGPWKNWQIRWFVRRYGVDLAAASLTDPRDYPDFNTFFTRALRPEARPVDAGAAQVVAPADGVLSQAGRIENGTLIQAKGRRLSLERLLGGDPQRSRCFLGGHYATVYLSPRDYHRVHMPVRGRLTEVIYVPGKLFSVNPGATRAVANLLARNERVISLFDTALGPLAVVMVGAVFVGSIEHVWSGVVTPPRGNKVRRWRYDGPDAPVIELEQGAEMGRFNMGSTVIVLLANPALDWDPALAQGAAVRMGQRIGALASQ